MVGAVGRDSAASEALNNLSRAGVDLSDIKRVSSATGTALILNEASGENMISVFLAPTRMSTLPWLRLLSRL